MDRFLKGFVSFLYPPLCLHCEMALKDRGLLFCSACLEHISLVETEERCRTCFGQLHKGRCERCLHRQVIICRQLAACEMMGPARTLAHAIKRGRKECISAAASLMVYQWLEQNQLMPDFLIPLPASIWQRQKIGFDAHLFLAKELGRLFSLPVLSILKSRFDRQYFLTQGEFRHRVVANGKKGGILCDQRVLLIAPELDDALFRSAGEELKPFFPSQIEGLSFAMSE